MSVVVSVYISETLDLDWSCLSFTYLVGQSPVFNLGSIPVLHIPSNGFKLFHWSTSGCNVPRNAAIHQLRQERRRLLVCKQGCKPCRLENTLLCLCFMRNKINSTNLLDLNYTHSARFRGSRCVLGHPPLFDCSIANSLINFGCLLTLTITQNVIMHCITKAKQTNKITQPKHNIKFIAFPH